MSPTLQEAPVVIIGGGLAGLTAACLLRHFDVPCVLLEKHVGCSLHPRAVGFTTRTLEIFDVIGIADKIPQMDAGFRLRRMAVQSLAGKWDGELGQMHAAAQPPSIQFSPFLGAAIAQDKLEPILRKRAVELGCDVRFGHRMRSFDADTKMANWDRIRILVRDPVGEEYSILTSYLLAADGHRSDVRTALGVPMRGSGYLKSIQSVLFRAPSLDKYLEKGFHQFAINNSEVGLRAFLTTYNDSRWVLMFQDDKNRAEPEMREAILIATGVSDLEFEIVTTGQWELKAQIADSFSWPLGNKPHIFLLGDAAHTLPPTRGGYGANTGIGDAHNLAWKLASVLQGHSRQELLASYDAERRPTATLRHNQTFAGPDYAEYRVKDMDYGAMEDGLAVELGQVYDSVNIVGGHRPGEGPLVLRPDESMGIPGVRAPHVWLLKTGQRMSSLAIFGKDWSLVTADSGWKHVADTVSREVGLTLRVLCPTDGEITEEVQGDICRQFGLENGAASLVRPDGVVAWRSSAWSNGDMAATELMAALKAGASLK